MLKNSAHKFVDIECSMILLGMAKERKSMSLLYRWKTRKEYKRKRQRVLALMKITKGQIN